MTLITKKKKKGKKKVQHIFFFCWVIVYAGARTRVEGH